MSEHTAENDALSEHRTYQVTAPTERNRRCLGRLAGNLALSAATRATALVSTLARTTCATLTRLVEPNAGSGNRPRAGRFALRVSTAEASGPGGRGSRAERQARRPRPESGIHLTCPTPSAKSDRGTTDARNIAATIGLVVAFSPMFAARWLGPWLTGGLVVSLAVVWVAAMVCMAGGGMRDRLDELAPKAEVRGE